MTNDPERPADSSPADEPRLSAEDVIERLQRLWASDPPGALGTPTLGHVGRYEIDRPLGHGTFGVVYLARDAQLGREVALKLPRPEVLIDEKKRRRFEYEARIAATLDHPAIVPIYEANLDGPAPYIASAYCPGADLASWLENHSTPIPWEQAVRFVLLLAQAVHYAHEHGVVHRDLKPGNVLLVSRRGDAELPAELADCEPRLTDFGLAKLTDGSLPDTRSSVLMGTPLYMAPEQLESCVPDDRAAAIDVYSLGCMLYELLTGRTPIEGETYVEVTDALRNRIPHKVRLLRPDVARDLETVCAVCLEKEPGDRYRSVAILAEDLERCLDGEPIQGRPPGWLARFAVWRRRPERIREAGIYTAVTHLGLTLWLFACLVGVDLFGVLRGHEFWANFYEMVFVQSTMHIPLILIGWQTFLGRRWAIWTGLGVSVLCVIGLVLTVLGITPAFELVYRNAEYHAFAGSAIVLILVVAQFVLYCFASSAERHRSRATNGSRSKG